jgi:ABC-2 type transport system ATP-binding protein
MPTITVDKINKTFGQNKAVNNVSFEVNPGEIFGLLGPNGSGKTTCIRILLDIYKADSGSVTILGGPMNEEKKNHIGYLPEERGLYQDIQLEKCLVYMATLKGMNKVEIAKSLPVYLEKFDLADHKKKKVKELSKGMQQKAQLIATLIHNPEIIIIDEPFSALDPVNTQLVKDLLIEQRSAGKTIVMCTHQMNQVEMLCDRIVLVDHGKVLLYGGLQEIRDQFATNEVLINTTSQIPERLAGVAEIRDEGTMTRLIPESNVSTQEILKNLVASGVELKTFEIATPTMDEVFIQVVQEGKDQHE